MLCEENVHGSKETKGQIKKIKAAKFRNFSVLRV